MSTPNTVQLLGHYGSDRTHAASAWTSTEREIDAEKRKRIPKLLACLARDGHHTPFEKSSLHFLVTTDIATHIHLLKHRVGVSINAESARYKELKEDKAFIPGDWPENWRALLQDHTKRGQDLYHEAMKSLTETHGMTRKRAKESARFFLGYNTQITADVLFNWRSFHHFLGLRMSEHAQREVDDIARQMLALVAGIKGNPFKHTLAAFGYPEASK